jgi:RHS repeat-associated protein
MSSGFNLSPSFTYQFTGKGWDEDVQLFYFNARWYDKDVGRFISEDPLWGSIFDPQSLNRFAYGRNNPYKYTDPTGMFNLNTGEEENPYSGFSIELDDDKDGDNSGFSLDLSNDGDGRNGVNYDEYGSGDPLVEGYPGDWGEYQTIYYRGVSVTVLFMTNYYQYYPKRQWKPGMDLNMFTLVGISYDIGLFAPPEDYEVAGGAFGKHGGAGQTYDDLEGEIGATMIHIGAAFGTPVVHSGPMSPSYIMDPGVIVP